MTTEIPLSVAVDNSAGLTRLRPRRAGRPRTINIYFDTEAPTGYRVRAWGSALVDDGGGAYAGTLELNPNELFASIHELREAWTREFIGYQLPADQGTRRYCFADVLDLRGAKLRAPMDTAMRTLARAGYKLLKTLFYAGDAGLKELGDAVIGALRADADQVISIHSDDLFIPWWMLYLPADDAVDLYARSAQWSYTGFLGYRHHIEHNFSRGSGWENGLEVTGRVKAGVHVDRRLDTQFPATPTIEPVIQIFREYADVVLREYRDELARDIVAADFADQILYFGCHATVTGAAATDQAHIALTDGEPIRTSDFRTWLMVRALHTNPIVYINACQGGQMSSMFYTSFSRVLLRYGANCLIGPQIDIPPAFAQWFATEFLHQLFRYETRVGDVVKDLTRMLIETYANPLGLVMSIYRGMDTHFITPKVQLS